LSRAKAGRFSQIEVNRGLPANLLVKHFKRVGNEWEIEANLRNHVQFMPLNLVKPWPLMPQMDLVMLRNVMIYFDVDAKKSILAKVQRLLRPGGYLMLGSAETTLNINEDFDRKVHNKTTCYQLKP
jgi:chemotaxis protein methyltransferase CheR